MQKKTKRRRFISEVSLNDYFTSGGRGNAVKRISFEKRKLLAV